MINKYPEFSKLSLDQKAQINTFTKLFVPYSDFNFTSLFAWDIDESTEVSLHNDNLVIRMPDYLDGSTVYSILGNNKIEESITELLEKTDQLKMVPASVIDALGANKDFDIVEDRDSFDYIYDLDHLTKLAGAKFKAKRYKSNVFVKDHSGLQLEVKTLSKITQAHAEELKHLDLQWARQTPRDQGDIVPERKAIARLLDNFDHFNLMLTEVIVDGQLKAFSINERIDDDYTICHFEKALSVHHEHINTFLVVQVAKQLKTNGHKWMNWEQDLGLDGLRNSKMSYHPDHMLKKYTVKHML